MVFKRFQHELAFALMDHIEVFRRRVAERFKVSTGRFEHHATHYSCLQCEVPSPEPVTKAAGQSQPELPRANRRTGNHEEKQTLSMTSHSSPSWEHININGLQYDRKRKGKAKERAHYSESSQASHRRKDKARDRSPDSSEGLGCESVSILIESSCVFASNFTIRITMLSRIDSVLLKLVNADFGILVAS